MMAMMMHGVDLCQSVAINLDGERTYMNERDHRCKGKSDDGKLYDRPGRLPTARHGGQVCFAMVEEATTVVVFVASHLVLPRFLQIPKRRFREQILKHWASLGVIGAHKSTRSFQRFWLEMDHKTRTQKHERNEQKTRKKHKLDNTTTTTSRLVHSASILSSPSEVLSIFILCLP